MRFWSKWKTAESRGRFLYQLEISSVLSVSSVVNSAGFPSLWPVRRGF